MRILEQSAALVLSIAFTLSQAVAQTPAEADLQKQATTAQQLYDQQNFLGALPWYEDLNTRVPANTARPHRDLLGKYIAKYDLHAA